MVSGIDTHYVPMLALRTNIESHLAIETFRSQRNVLPLLRCARTLLARVSQPPIPCAFFELAAAIASAPKPAATVIAHR